DVEARVVRHLDQRRDAAAGLSDGARPGAPVLDLRRGVRAVACLLLEALDLEIVARAIRERAWHEEAAHALLAPREGEETVAHRRRAEPLVASEAPRFAVALRARRHRAQVRSALLLGHRHADRRAPLALVRKRPRIVGIGEHLAAPRT